MGPGKPTLLVSSFIWKLAASTEMLAEIKATSTWETSLPYDEKKERIQRKDNTGKQDNDLGLIQCASVTVVHGLRYLGGTCFLNK